MDDYEDLALEDDAFEFEDDPEVFEDESYEADEFLPALGALLPLAAKAAPTILGVLGNLFESEGEAEGEADFLEADDGFEEYEDDGFGGDFEGDDDFESEDDDYEEVDLAAQASKTTSPKVAAVAAGAMAAKATRKLPPKLKKKVAKPLTKAATAIVKTLRKIPNGKALMPIVPKVLKSATKDIKRVAQSGRPVPKKAVVKAVAKSVAKNLRSQSAIKKAKKAHAFKRKELNKLAIKRAEKFA